MYSRDQTTCCLCGSTISEPYSVFQCFTLNEEHRYYEFAGAVAHHKCLAVYDRVADFLEFYFAVVLDVFQHSYWALVPVGDDFVDCMDSIECQTPPPEYDSAHVIRALHNFGNVRQYTKDGQCRLIWESDSEAVEYVFGSTGIWKGAVVEMACQPMTFLNQWRHLHTQFGQIYLHNQDCTIFAPDYFASIYVNTPLRKFQAKIMA